jgi:hypothetical protein
MELFRVKIEPIPETSVRLNTQAPVPLHPAADPLPPVEPAKADPAFGAAIRLNAVL